MWNTELNWIQCQTHKTRSFHLHLLAKDTTIDEYREDLLLDQFQTIDYFVERRMFAAAEAAQMDDL